MTRQVNRTQILDLLHKLERDIPYFENFIKIIENNGHII